MDAKHVVHGYHRHDDALLQIGLHVNQALDLAKHDLLDVLCAERLIKPFL